MRLTRSGMLDVLEADYIRTARAKGLSTASVIFKHALRNAIMTDKRLWPKQTLTALKPILAKYL